MTAWATGTATFLVSGALIGLEPKPSAGSGQPQVVVIKRTIKRVVWQRSEPALAAKPKVRIVASGGGSPAAPAAATTSGSHAG
jgi:hypothetical protein